MDFMDDMGFVDEAVHDVHVVHSGFQSSRYSA